jgi:hypothetical protein
MTDVEPYMLLLINEPIVQPEKKIILKNPEPIVKPCPIADKPARITNESTIMDIPVQLLKGYSHGFSTNQVKTILCTQYLLNLSKLDNDSFWKVCENCKVTYPKIGGSIYTAYKRPYMMDELIERFKKIWDILHLCSASQLHNLYSKYYNKIIDYIHINPHYIDEYRFAIVYYNMCNLTHFIGDD